MGIPGLGKELEDVDKALSAGDLSFRYLSERLSVRVKLSLLFNCHNVTCDLYERHCSQVKGAQF